MSSPHHPVVLVVGRGSVGGGVSDRVGTGVSLEALVAAAGRVEAGDGTAPLGVVVQAPRASAQPRTQPVPTAIRRTRRRPAARGPCPGCIAAPPIDRLAVTSPDTLMVP